jgi:hypothetical protein
VHGRLAQAPVTRAGAPDTARRRSSANGGTGRVHAASQVPNPSTSTAPPETVSASSGANDGAGVHGGGGAGGARVRGRHSQDMER